MTLNSMEELTPVHYDVLREIGNIGQGNAATALAAFSNKLVTIDVPNVRVLDITDAIEYLGGPENIVTGILIRLKGDINGMMLTVLQSSFVKNLVEMVFDRKPSSPFDLDDTEKSFIQEIGNILSGSYLNAISSLSGMTTDVSVPSVTTDMVGAILAVPAVEFAELGSKVLFIDDCFTFSDGFGKAAECSASRSNMILIPDIDSLSALFDRLSLPD
ncbi:MAG: chemotaxis protein CheC [Oscillospiraceae bacterium]|nr:chemotaxis protein CheC [Oscillospiraceae bacterium]